MNEKVLDENSLMMLFESKVVIKNEAQRIEFYLGQISKVRIFKKRNLAMNYLIFIVAVMFYSSIVTPKNVNNLPFIFVSIFVFLILFIISFLLKFYNYKLLINKGILGFSEIALSKKNIRHAENFICKFNSQEQIDLELKKGDMWRIKIS